jgi:hypothetical protein
MGTAQQFRGSCAFSLAAIARAKMQVAILGPAQLPAIVIDWPGWGMVMTIRRCIGYLGCLNNVVASQDQISPIIHIVNIELSVARTEARRKGQAQQSLLAA